MPMVYIKCPATGFLVATDHILPDEIALKKPIHRHMTVQCPFCKGDHVWDDTNGLFLSIPDNAPIESFGKR